MLIELQPVTYKAHHQQRRISRKIDDGNASGFVKNVELALTRFFVQKFIQLDERQPEKRPPIMAIAK
jgi:hypothetical protein